MSRLNGSASIYTAEAYAINKALLNILDKRIPSAIIATDSLSVLHSIYKEGLHNTAHYIIALIRQKILAIRNRGGDIKLYWIPSHIGIKGNDIADEGAKKASRRPKIDENMITYIDWLNAYFIEEKKNYYEDLCSYGGPSNLKGANYMSHTKSINNRPWFSGHKLIRRDITYVNRIRAGHYQLNAHLHRMNIVDSPDCECGLPQSIDHIVWICPLYTQGRSKMYDSLVNAGVVAYSSVTNIFLEQPIQILAEVLQFLYLNAILI